MVSSRTRIQLSHRGRLFLSQVAFSSGEVINSFQDDCHGGHLGFPIRTLLDTFYLQITPKVPIQVQVDWPYVSGKEVKNRFSRWLPWQPSWISDQNDFTFFYLQVTLMLPTKFRVNWPFGSGGAKNRFSRWCHGGHLGFPIGTIFAISDLPVTPMLPTKF